MTIFWLHSGYILITFWLHSDCIMITFWLQSDYTLTTLWLHSDCRVSQKKGTNKTYKNGQTWQPFQHSKVVERGPKGFEMVNLDFFTIWEPFGPVWTLLDHFKRKMIFCSKALSPNPSLSFWATNWFLSEIVQKGPDGPKRVPNCQKHQG